MNGAVFFLVILTFVLPAQASSFHIVVLIVISFMINELYSFSYFLAI